MVIFAFAQQIRYDVNIDHILEEQGHQHNSNQPLDDRAHCAQSAFTYLGFWRKLYNCPWPHFTAS